MTLKLEYEKETAKCTLKSNDKIISLQFMQGFYIDEDGKIADDNKISVMIWLLSQFMEEMKEKKAKILKH